MCDRLTNTKDMHKIPPELEEFILNNLQGDRKTMVASALVCKIWLPGIRYNLFYTIAIDWKEEECTISLRRAMQDDPEAGSLVRNLIISDACGLEKETKELLENMPNLELLSFRRPKGREERLATVYNRHGDRKVPTLRFLQAIAKLENL